MNSSIWLRVGSVRVAGRNMIDCKAICSLCILSVYFLVLMKMFILNFGYHYGESMIISGITYRSVSIHVIHSSFQESLLCTRHSVAFRGGT